MNLYPSQFALILLASVSLLPIATLAAQEITADAADAVSADVVSATQKAPDEPAAEVNGEEAETKQSEPFQLPREHHRWARFEPGAWREVEVVTETFDESGQLANRSTTTQKEILDAVADGKYALRVQATVLHSGKQIAGDWKTRALEIATDSASPLSESRRLEDRVLSVAGRSAECQVWELFYPRNGTQLREVIHYAPSRYPYVLQRETSEPEQNESQELQQRTRVTAVDVSFQIRDKPLKCACSRTYRHRAKGETITFEFTNPDVPGGEVVVRTTDLDAEGRRVRWTVTTLLDFGESAPSTDGTADAQ